MSQPYFQKRTKNIQNLLRQDLRFLHIIIGPRQTGKTTAAGQIEASWPGRSLYATADSPIPPGTPWLHHQWNRASSIGPGALLIIDEVQKIAGWSETVKQLWDTSLRNSVNLRVLLLGSSSLLIQKGLSESLSGRFLLHPFSHWGFSECHRAFDYSLDEWLYFGGYPGAAPLRANQDVWRNYIRDSLVDTVLNRDILQTQTVHKPALLRQLFLLACGYPSHILSWSKMIGQLTDAGNTTTLAHYAEILRSAFLLSGLDLYRTGERKRRSSPKLIVWNNGLAHAIQNTSFEKAQRDTEWWGFIVENAVGAHMLNNLRDFTSDLYYWRHRNEEVDFVLSSPRKLWAIEVKSSRMKNPKGLSTFCRLYPNAKPFIVGGSGMPLEQFFMEEPKNLFS